MKPVWALLVLTWLFIVVLLWRMRQQRREFQRQTLATLDAAMAGMELRHVAQMEGIREVWSQIESDGEPPEMLAELAREEERHRQEVESMRKARDRIRTTLGTPKGR
jgi:hypothetical protein